MSKVTSILSGSKIWHLIKDIMEAINSGKRPAQDVCRNDKQYSKNHAYIESVARSYSIR